MNDVTKQQISDAMHEYVDRTGLTQADIARGADVRSEYVCSIYGGNFVYGNKNTVLADKYFNAIARYIGYKPDKSHWGLVKTSQLKTISVSLGDAQSKSIVKAIIGETGCGKTYSAKAYYESYKQNHVYLVKVSSLHELKDVIYDICMAIGVEPKKGKVTNLRLITAKMQELHDSGVRPLLIIDESENLKLPVLGLFKAIYDAIVDTRLCGLALIGTQEMLDKIDKMARKKKDGVAQFARRIKAGRVILKEIDKSNYKEFLDDKIEDRELKLLLTQLSDNYGELNNYLEPALIEADEAGQPLTVEFFRDMYGIGADH